jgi:hypothetical protein
VHKIWARLRCASRLLAPGHVTCLELCEENASTDLHPRTERVLPMPLGNQLASMDGAPSVLSPAAQGPCFGCLRRPGSVCRHARPSIFDAPPHGSGRPGRRRRRPSISSQITPNAWSCRWGDLPRV